MIWVLNSPSHGVISTQCCKKAVQKYAFFLKYQRNCYSKSISILISSVGCTSSISSSSSFSKSIKAGKRIYYLDVKKNRKDEMFLAITESKKVIMGEGDDSQVSFEKHKIFFFKSSISLGLFIIGFKIGTFFSTVKRKRAENEIQH